MKRIILVALVLIMALSCMVGCKDDDGEINNAQQQGAVKKVDYDLSSMSLSMASSTAINIKNNPQDYIGKTIKLSGSYNASYYALTNQYYNYIVIIDNTACCQTAIEFIYEGKTYPDDFPANNTNITIRGTFGSYVELNKTYYCIYVTSMTVNS